MLTKPSFIVRCAVILGLVTLISACSAPGKTRDEQRSGIEALRNEVLTELHRLKPDTRPEVRKAPGYGVFSNVNVNVIFASGSNGYGVVVDNRTGKRTYMKMAELGIGLGLGVKDFRAVFVFDDTKVMQRFVDSGWQFGGHADAAAKAQDKGAAVGAEAVVDGIRIYQITESGLALQATVKGTKYWKDSALN